MEKITITRALNELKLLDSRINKKISSLQVVDSYQERNKVAMTSRKEIGNFNENETANYQSIIDVIERRKKIKSAVLKANAENKVKIGNNDYTVIEAIERKISITYDENLLNQIKKNYVSLKNTIDTKRLECEQQVQDMLIQSLGTDKKNNSEDYKNIAVPFIEANELKMIDPLGAEELIKKTEEDIETFKSEVDFVLSESNAINTIEI